MRKTVRIRLKSGKFKTVPVYREFTYLGHNFVVTNPFVAVVPMRGKYSVTEVRTGMRVPTTCGAWGFDTTLEAVLDAMAFLKSQGKEALDREIKKEMSNRILSKLFNSKEG